MRSLKKNGLKKERQIVVKTLVLVLVALSLGIMVLAVAGSISQGGGYHKESVVTVETVDFSTITKTVGNHSYVNFPMSGRTFERTDELLRLLNKFEDFYSKLRVTGWKVDCQFVGWTGLICGLWIDPEPR